MPLDQVAHGVGVEKVALHSRDVAKGHLLAFEQGKAGERYILGGENINR